MIRRHSGLVALLAIALTMGDMGGTAFADPCGMVPPPLQIATSRPIERIGVQKTYVAFDKGIETMVLRPGFRGKVEEFGMLIPFPSPPSIRKVDDNIFSHISAAIDPPEVIARVQRFRGRGRGRPMRSAKSKRAPARDMAAESSLAFDEVRVVRQEAVGMYEVAVLAAGGAQALQRWMNDNGFRYPTGMDAVVAEYVQSKWFFVAIKTNVGQKAGVNPRPGMRSVNSKRPAGSTFNGFVQAMGFRFRTKELVIPMRLSVFNADGNSRNIVYALTDDPSKITGIPEGFVVRQVSGKRLHQNVTNPLPLRVIGGTKKDLNPSQIANLPKLRDPARHNGLAKELFASDMLAISRGRLANRLEEQEKKLLNIGEALGMRGRIIDDLNRAELKKQRDRLGKQSLRRLRSMTLTVIDGAFDRKVLAKQNLKFKKYRMAKSKNTPRSYDANRQGPGFNQGGTLYRWELAYRDDESVAPALVAASLGGGSGGSGPALPILGVLLAFGLLLMRRRRWQAVAVAGLLLLGGSSVVSAQLIATSPSYAIEQGESILALVKQGTPAADKALAAMVADSNRSLLVRSWAAAGRMQVAKTSEELLALEGLSRSFPATRRPWGKRMLAMARRGNPEALFDTIARVPELRAELQTELAALPSKTLLRYMLSGKSQQIRQQSASLLGAKGKGTDRLVAIALRFHKKASKTPWHGGALYLPSVTWSKAHAKALAFDLLRWMLWAEKKGDTQTIRVAANNLQSAQLASAAGYTASPGNAAYTTEYWLGVWAKAYGSKAMDQLLKDVK